MSDSKSGRFLDRYLGARVPGNPSRHNVLAALREHVYLKVMLAYERDDGTMTDLYKGVLVEASRDPGTWGKGWRPICSLAKSLPLRTIEQILIGICSAGGSSPGRSPR